MGTGEGQAFVERVPTHRRVVACYGLQLAAESALTSDAKPILAGQDGLKSIHCIRDALLLEVALQTDREGSLGGLGIEM
jgi:hypothetical protein